MTRIQQTLQKIDAVDLKRDDAIDALHTIVSTELRKLPIFMTNLAVSNGQRGLSSCNTRLFL